MARKSKLWKSSGVAAAKASDEKEHRQKAKALREERVVQGRSNDLQKKYVTQPSRSSRIRRDIARDLALHSLLSGQHLSLMGIQSRMRGPFGGIPKGELFTIDGCPSPMTVRTKAEGIAELNSQIGEPQGLIDGEDLVVHSAPTPLFPHSRQDGVQWVDMELSLDEFVQFMITKSGKNIDSAVTALENLRERKGVEQEGNDLSITLTEFWEKDSKHGLPTRLLGTYIPEKDAVRCRLTIGEADDATRRRNSGQVIRAYPVSCDVGTPVPKEGITISFDPTQITNSRGF